MERKRSVKRRKSKPFAETAKDHCRAFTAFLFSNVGIIILVVLYMVAGAFMFIEIEGTISQQLSEEMHNARELLANQLWNLSCCQLIGYNSSIFKEEISASILNYQNAIVNATRKGWSGAVSKDQNEWNFSGALLYSLTVITTIGYGHIAPRTPLGKIATIFYAIFGMPLFLLYLSNIGDVLAKSFKWIYAKVCLCRICPGVAKRREARERKKIKMLSVERPNMDEYLSDTTSFSSQMDTSRDDDEPENDKEIDSTNTVTVPLTICLMIMIGYVLLGATTFIQWEDWSILDGCYFCFISLSSIGFGDFVPGDTIMQTEHLTSKDGSQIVLEVKFIVCAIYLLLGMALIAMCFNLMQEQVTYKIRSFKRGIRRCFRCAI